MPKHRRDLEHSKQFMPCTNLSQNRKRKMPNPKCACHTYKVDLSNGRARWAFDIIKNFEICFFFVLLFAFWKFHRTFSDDKLCFSRKICSKYWSRLGNLNEGEDDNDAKPNVYPLKRIPNNNRKTENNSGCNSKG